MRTLTIALVVLTLTVFCNTQAKARNNVVDGLIVGTAVGSIVGLIVGSEIKSNSYNNRPVYHQPVVYVPPPPPSPHYGGWERTRHNYPVVRNCRELVIVRDNFGRHSKTVKTVCRERR